jgi:ATP phosphoribosyltransferase
MDVLRIGLPKGRMQEGVLALLQQAGIRVRFGARGYRPAIDLPQAEAKLLKPQNLLEMLAQGSRDVGFAGSDWRNELGVDVVEVLDTGLDPVRIVAAAPEDLLVDGALPQRPLRVVSEYERTTREWIARRGVGDRYVRSYGATEAFPPEDGDCIVDNCATGATLAANGLVVVDELGASSTRMYASPGALRDPGRRQAIEDLVLVLGAVLEARNRVMVEVNCTAERLEAVARVLPCMREPTISRLYGEGGYAVKAAVPRSSLPRLIPAIRAAGGTDVVVVALSQIAP